MSFIKKFFIFLSNIQKYDKIGERQDRYSVTEQTLATQPLLSCQLTAYIQGKAQMGIQVFNPAGKMIAYLKTPNKPTNIAFGRGSEKREHDIA